MTGSRHEGHEIGDDRCEERQILGVLAKDAISEVDEVVHAASHLHRRDGHDDGHDDRHDIKRHRAGFQPEESQHEYAEPAGEADGDAAQPSSEEDRQQDDRELDGNHAVTPFNGASAEFLEAKTLPRNSGRMRFSGEKILSSSSWLSSPISRTTSGTVLPVRAHSLPTRSPAW